VSQSELYLKIAVWSQVVSSVVFIAVLIYIWQRYVLPVLLAAQERSNRQIADAERHRDEAKEAVEALGAEIESARRDAVLIARRAAERAEHERQQVLKEATDAGERAVADADRELDRARAAARAKVRDDLVALALQIAREDASKRIGADLDAKFVENFAGSLEGGGRG